MKPITILIFFLGHCAWSFGQGERSGTELSNLTKLDLGFQGIGLTYEPRLSNKITADISAGAGGGYEIGDGSMEVDYGKPGFYFSLTPKYFYNRQSRIDRGKKSLLNSGNYVGLRLKYITPFDRADLTSNSILVNLHWGIQRAISNRWTFNSHIGAGYGRNVDDELGTVYPAIELKFSYIFSKVQK